MASPSFLLNPPSLSQIIQNSRPITTTTTTTFPFHRKYPYSRSSTFRASAASSSSVSILEFDLYDLLGIDSGSDLVQIKAAYRALQKRCHPDIAGPAGHDMAIILNEAYAVLSDQSSRSVYDKKHGKSTSLRGYTARPLYSTWFGSESEQRAVFVDEVKCVGCLKCALLADKTFAIESVYGRARVVAQWADREDKIQDAIDACPVNCISIVERADLAALEFLMSKKPRGRVRIGVGNTVGQRVSDVFNDLELFQRRYRDAKNKVSTEHSNESDLQTSRRTSAIQTIMAISNWLYWQTPNAPSRARENIRVTFFLPAARSVHQPNIDKIREAAEARKYSAAGEAKVGNSTYVGASSPNQRYDDEYWVPSSLELPSSMNDTSSATTTAATMDATDTSPQQVDDRSPEKNTKRKNRVNSPVALGIPLATAMVAMVVVGTNGAETVVGGLEEHIGGPFALGIVNSSWLQIASAGAAWYAVGLVMSDLIEVLRGKGK